MFSRGLIAIISFAFVSAVHAEEPRWLQEARARESKPSAARRLKSADGWLKARVPARVVGAIARINDTYSIKLDIGAPTPIYCSITRGEINLADMLRRAAESTLTRAEETQGKVEDRQIENLDAGAFGNVPYIAATWRYSANGAKGLLAGAIKQVAMSRNGAGMYCAHVDLGYDATFRSVARALAHSLTIADPPRAPYYQEISAMRLGGVKCGVTVSTLTRGQDGSTVARETTSLLMPGTQTKAVSLDAIHNEIINSSARLLNATHVTTSSGEMTTNLALESKDGDWTVTGELQGKRVSVALPKGARPGTWMTQAQELRRILSTPDPVGAEHGIEMWSSSDPARLTLSSTRVVSKVDATHYLALGSTGAVAADMTLDVQTGMASTTAIRIGPQTVRIERVYVEGRP
jgi:hypothetical protein